ncbi:MAG: hypothetical protein LQ352_001286 [Teloschistes flavicans]|nr:MAG: hypothetical protein LQ352_001286 [Teloschistes flavicans]
MSSIRDRLVDNQVKLNPTDKEISSVVEDLRSGNAQPEDIANTIYKILSNELSDEAQIASFLALLSSSGLDRKPAVVARCAQAMRRQASRIDQQSLLNIVQSRRGEGSYHGGFCDLVGTGGDGHSTYNVSTTASILASSLVLISKYGNRAASSNSGSADLLQAIKPKPPAINSVTAETLPRMYERSTYAFLFAQAFYSGLRIVAPIRKKMGSKTIFNLLGPLTNPIHENIEARVVGVAEIKLGLLFAEALSINGARKTLVVCGHEQLDEISCAGKTSCWRIVERPNPAFHEPKSDEDKDLATNDEDGRPRTLVDIQQFTIEPSDFGLQRHQLSEVSPGKNAEQNAAILMRLLRDELPRDDPVLEFVLLNTAALFAISGICDGDTSDMGHGDNGKVILETGPGGLRWKEGVRRARWAVESGRALASLDAYVEASRTMEENLR